VIELVVEPRRRDLGGFEVARLLPASARRMVGPFIFLDRMGPAKFAAGLPRSTDVRPHPHIGLSTFTYLFEGEVESGGARHTSGQLLVFDAHADAVVAARTPARVMLLGGEPVGERFIEWNFVSSSRERIEQAKADWRAGRMKLPDLDRDELIPLP
jgi:redox-sensitive bicupin YhaK (pirin superfamily)